MLELLASWTLITGVNREAESLLRELSMETDPLLRHCTATPAIRRWHVVGLQRVIPCWIGLAVGSGRGDRRGDRRGDDGALGGQTPPAPCCSVIGPAPLERTRLALPRLQRQPAPRRWSSRPSPALRLCAHIQLLFFAFGARPARLERGLCDPPGPGVAVDVLRLLGDRRVGEPATTFEDDAPEQAAELLRIHRRASCFGSLMCNVSAAAEVT